MSAVREERGRGGGAGRGVKKGGEGREKSVRLILFRN